VPGSLQRKGLRVEINSVAVSYGLCVLLNALAMIINIGSSGDEEFEIIELQGELENIELINCELDRERIELHFDTFFLQGILKEEKYTLIEKIDTEQGAVLRKVHVADTVYFFNKPPRYKLYR
jgi:hypothetical protein